MMAQFFKKSLLAKVLIPIIIANFMVGSGIVGQVFAADGLRPPAAKTSMEDIIRDDLRNDGGVAAIDIDLGDYEYLKQPKLNFEDTEAVRKALKNIIEVNETALNKVKRVIDATGMIKVINQQRLREELIDKLVYDATFNPDQKVVDLCRKLIWEIAVSLGIKLNSIYDLYVQKAKDMRHYTVPATNIRGNTYDAARAMFESIIENNVGTFIIEIAKSEIGYTKQRPVEYTTSILAAAIKQGYHHRDIQMQGDHFQMSAEEYTKNPTQARDKIKELIKEAMEAGFYNIDLDMSTLVDWRKETADKQQELNYKETALLTAYVRQLEIELGLTEKGIVVNLGGEIGEIGMGLEKGKERNSNVGDLLAFWEGYTAELEKLGSIIKIELKPITKIAIQVGTKHGGIRDEQGNIVKANVSFNTIAELGKEARKLGLVVVLHGASTLDHRCYVVFAGEEVPEGFVIPAELLSEGNKIVLSENPAGEIHLATLFQDITIERFPEPLREAMKKYILARHSVKEGETKEGVFVNNRKRAWGDFKLITWNLPESIRKQIRGALKDKFDTIFKNLGVWDSDKYVNEARWGENLAPFVEELRTDIYHRLSPDVIGRNNKPKGKVYPILINHESLLKESPDGIMALQGIMKQLGGNKTQNNIKFVLHINRDDIEQRAIDGDASIDLLEQSLKEINKTNKNYTNISRAMFAGAVVGIAPEEISNKVEKMFDTGIYQVIGPESYVSQFEDVMRIVIGQAEQGQLASMAKALKLGLELIPTEGKVSKEGVVKLDELFSLEDDGSFHVGAMNVTKEITDAVDRYAKQVEAKVRI